MLRIRHPMLRSPMLRAGVSQHWVRLTGSYYENSVRVSPEDHRVIRHSALRTPHSELPNSELRTPNPELPNSELRTPNPEPRTPNSEPRTPNSELRTLLGPQKDFVLHSFLH